MDADAQILKWARSKWGGDVESVYLYEPTAEAECETCGYGEAITTTVLLTLPDDKRVCHDVDFDTALIREILAA